MKKHFLVLLIAITATASTICQPEIRMIRPSGNAIGLYQKLELSMNLQVEYENPFDPDQVDIMATFIAPSGKQWRVPGFYTETRWSSFKVRFSPNETGKWSYSITVRDKNGETTSDSRTFTAIESAHHGPIRTASNKRYLEHADGTPWYGIGLWYNGNTDTEVLDELEQRGVNYISRLIAPLETWGTGMGRYDQASCTRIDELLEELEERVTAAHWPYGSLWMK